MSLSSLDYETLAADLLVILAYAYAAFWALNVRGKLSVKLYRHQALGVGVVAICVAYFASGVDSAINFLPGMFFEAPLDTILFYVYLASTGPLLYWTDSSLLAAKDSDPLERDVLGWTRIRTFVWGAMVVALGGGGVYLLYQSVFLPQLDTSSAYLPGAPSIVNNLAGGVPLVVPFAVAVVFLPVAVRRTKDLILRRHLKWFGLGAVFLVLGILSTFVEILTGGSGGTVNLPVEPILFVFLYGTSAYCFYRSARAVVPIYSLKEGT